MAATDLKRTLDSSKELEITVTGRKTGKKITLPIWFVKDGGKLLFLPVQGSETNWFRNIKHSPTMRISAGGTSITVKKQGQREAQKEPEQLRRSFEPSMGLRMSRNTTQGSTRLWK